MFRGSILISCLVTVFAQNNNIIDSAWSDFEFDPNFSWIDDDVTVFALDNNKIDSAWSNVEFDKFSWIDDEKVIHIDFPLTKDQATYLQSYSRSISIVLQGPNEECSDALFSKVNDRLQKNKLSPPLHPGDKKFWLEFGEVVKVQTLLKQSQRDEIDEPLHQVMPLESLPELWKDYGISDVSQAVNDEFPGVYHSQMIALWLKDGLSTNELIPKSGKVDFLRGPVFFSDMIGVAIRLVGSCNFALKWNFGLARPEEIAYKIKMGDIAAPDFRNMINFTDAIDKLSYDTSPGFTDYVVGSPNHPSWPAMHSAASAASFWLNIVTDLSVEQLCEARKLDYAISYARTVAGVHYPQDNIAGLIAGQEILIQTLPTYLHRVYGSDKDMVRKRAKLASYDWKKFTSSNCYLGRI